MLTAIEIENFKGFGPRQRIDFAPLTLFFGRNSGGKSSVFHAIAFLKQILDTGHATLGMLPSSEGRLSLGGFRQTVHGQDVRKPITLTIQFTVPKGRIPPPAWADDPMTGPQPELYIACALMEITVEVSFAPPSSSTVTRFALTADGEEVLSIIKQAGLNGEDGIAHCQMNLVWAARHQISNESESNEVVAWPRTCKQASALPNPQSLPFAPYDFFSTATEVYFDHLVHFATTLARSQLSGLMHLGPLRDLPTSEYEATNDLSANRWYTGIAAWDAIHWMPASGIEQVNDWLSDDRLAAGVQIWRQELIDVTHLSRYAYPQLNTDLTEMWHRTTPTPRLRFVPTSQRQTLMPTILRPQDIGVGISQLLPVVVACVDRRGRLLLIEQPELHLHPSLQTSLGDLLLAARLSTSSESSSPIVVETHSEHLILRVLRRIRETHDGELPPPPSRHCRPDDVAVYFFENNQEGTKATRLRIGADGEFIDRWPYGFFDERSEELF